MKETAIVAAIVKRLRQVPGVWVRKIHGSGYNAGLPDLSIIAGGAAVWLEVKQPGKRATVLQEKTMDEMRAAGAVCSIVTSADEAVGIVEAVLNDRGSI